MMGSSYDLHSFTLCMQTLANTSLLSNFSCFCFFLMSNLILCSAVLFLQSPLVSLELPMDTSNSSPQPVFYLMASYGRSSRLKTCCQGMAVPFFPCDGELPRNAQDALGHLFTSILIFHKMFCKLSRSGELPLRSNLTWVHFLMYI